MTAKSEIALSLAAFLLAPPAAAVAQQAIPCPTTEEAKLVASETFSYANFGASVAISGDTVVVGATSQGIGNEGVAYVFVRNGASWSEQAKLTNDGRSYEKFGASVAISGDTVVVGAPHQGNDDEGAAYVFVRDGTTWSEQQKLIAPDAEAGAQFGVSIAVSSDLVVVGAAYDDFTDFMDAGSAYVFVRNGTTWSEQQKLTASDAAAADWFGLSVAASGDTVVVGAYSDDHTGGTNAGSAYVFVWNGTSWIEQQKLTASDGGSNDEFGWSVAISGDTAVVGGRDHTSGASAGSAYVFVRNGTSWIEHQKLTPSDGESGDWFGYSVAVAGDRVVVGAPHDGYGGEADVGSAYVYVRSGTSWIEQQKLTASDAAADVWFGNSVAVAGDRAVVGAEFDDHTTVVDAGSAYVFDLSGWISDWVSYCTAGTSASGCQATLSGCGAASASAPSGFDLTASSVEAKKDGLFYFGTNGRQANSWGNGTSFQCVVPPVVRTGVFTRKGLLGTCNASYSQDLNSLWCPTCPDPQKNPGAGAVVQAQFWYRDPLSTSNQTTSLSDAIEFPVHP